MQKKLEWVHYDERTDVRDVRAVGRGNVIAILGDGMQGWGGRTHLVMATGCRPNSSPYASPAHVTLTKEEAESLPLVGSIREFADRFEGW